MSSTDLLYFLTIISPTFHEIDKFLYAVQKNSSTDSDGKTDAFTMLCFLWENKSFLYLFHSLQGVLIKEKLIYAS